MKVKRKTTIKSIIPVASMSDIAFLLLIFLMLSTIVNIRKGPVVNTPKAIKLSRPKEVQKYEIIIDKNGNYFFEDRYVLKDEISAIFKFKILDYPDLFVQINGDENTPYEHIDELIKALQEAECYRVLFICKKIKKGRI